MAIDVFCKECNKTYSVGDDRSGNEAKCPAGHAIVIPVPTSTAAASSGAVPLSNNDAAGAAPDLARIWIWASVGVLALFVLGWYAIGWFSSSFSSFDRIQIGMTQMEAEPILREIAREWPEKEKYQFALLRVTPLSSIESMVVHNSKREAGVKFDTQGRVIEKWQRVY